MTPEEKKTATAAATVQEKAAELQRQYVREYRRRHPEKVREWNQNYWRRKAEKAAKTDDHVV